MTKTIQVRIVLSPELRRALEEAKALNAAMVPLCIQLQERVERVYAALGNDVAKGLGKSG